MNLDALYKLCREKGLHSTNMQVLVGHKAGNTNGTQGGKAHECGWVRWSVNDVKWLKRASCDEIVPTIGATHGKGGGELFLQWAQANRPDMRFTSETMLVKLFHGKNHKGKKVENLCEWPEARRR